MGFWVKPKTIRQIFIFFTDKSFCTASSIMLAGVRTFTNHPIPFHRCIVTLSNIRLKNSVEMSLLV